MYRIITTENTVRNIIFHFIELIYFAVEKGCMHHSM